MKDIYDGSWELYKAQTETFLDDLEYYSRFIGNNHALELFAGFGRITNPLIETGHSIETVEIQDKFAQFINLNTDKNHICDVLEFSPHKKFDRIFAAYNSFCLFTKEVDIHLFFSLLGTWLNPGGKISLNYYHPDYWAEAVESEFVFNNNLIQYRPDFDLSDRKTKKIGVWIDHFLVNNKIMSHKYVTRIYESEHDLVPFLKGTGLRITNSVFNFNLDTVKEPGWIDFILEK